MTSGEQRKREGISTAVINSDTKYRIRFNNRLAELVERGETFTSEDITSVVGIPNDKIVGALMNAAATGGYIKRLAYVPAERGNQHAAMISRWMGTSKHMERVLLADDLPIEQRVSRWFCTVCGQPASLEPSAGLDPTIGMGKCLVCKKPSTFRYTPPRE